jgi:hypothetical protein
VNLAARFDAMRWASDAWALRAAATTRLSLFRTRYRTPIHPLVRTERVWRRMRPRKKLGSAGGPKTESVPNEGMDWGANFSARTAGLEVGPERARRVERATRATTRVPRPCCEGARATPGRGAPRYAKALHTRSLTQTLKLSASHRESYRVNKRTRDGVQLGLGKRGLVNSRGGVC